MEKPMTKQDKEERGNLVRGAQSHIKSILVGLKKFKRGSRVEAEYIAEHLEKLDKYYLQKIINYKTPEI